ncbi:calcium-binding protein [Egbenema bharatensis]|uniref:calcium-binding protein n=1 Tax=Egbenema bharatensis TaxID=3463334 RepID=UPI003A864B3E
MVTRRSGGSGNDTITAEQSGIWPIKWWDSWHIDGGAGNDSLTGGGKNDTLLGGSGNDTLVGLDGDDSLDGGTGNDRMIGGKGNDTYVVDSEQDQIIERDGEGTDWVQSHARRYVLPNFVENLTLMNDATKGVGIVGIGNNQANRIEGNRWDNELRGGGGNDTIVGGGGKDTIYGDAGDDWLYGSDSGSTFYGGEGNDTLSGGAGTTLYGGTGNDTYHIHSNNTPVIIEYANEGTDTLMVFLIENGQPLNESYRMSDDLQFVERVQLHGGTTGAVGNRFDNTLIANNGYATSGSYLDGAAGNDTLLGGKYNDTLIGGTGSDRMVGGDGNDHLIGLGGGVDTMVGGAGADTFYLKDFYRNNQGYAVIEDFSRAQGDKISVQGQASDYLLRLADTAGVRGSLNDIAIFHKPTNMLVGVVADNTTVTLTQDFQFVPGA